MPSPRCDAGANLTGWRHSWDEVVEFTFTTVEDECREETAVPKTQIAGLALSYLCRYLTLAEDDSLTGGGGGTQGCSTGAAASGRRPAGVRNRSDPGEVGSSTLVSIMAAFKHLAGVHPSYDDHFCKLWPAARLTKARPRSPSPPPSPPRALAPAPPALTPQRARTYAPCAPAPPRPGTRALARPLTRLTPRSPLPPGHAQGARAQAGADAAGLRPLAPSLTAPPHPPATPCPAVPRRAPPRPAAPGAFCSAPAAVTHPAPLPSAAVADAPVLPHAVHGAGRPQPRARPLRRRLRAAPAQARRGLRRRQLPRGPCCPPLPTARFRTLPPCTPAPPYPRIHTHTHTPAPRRPPPKWPPVLARRRRHA